VRSLPQRTPRSLPDTDLADAITYQGFYNFIQQYIDENTIVGSDASMNYFGCILLDVPAPGAFIVQSSYSAIGYIAPAATGICLAKNDDQRVMVVSGDGGFQMTAQCLSTQSRFGLNPIIFVMNNGVYGEQWLADSTVFETDKPFFDSCILHRWDYSKLADVFGCRGWKATTHGELQKAVEDALGNVDSPSIIDVEVPQKSIPDNAAWKSQ
jgi:indolepyruvate decarboxylase